MTEKKTAVKAQEPQKTDIGSMRIAKPTLDRLRKYGVKGDSDEMIVTRVLNELSAFRINNGLPREGVLQKNITKGTGGS